MKHFHLLSIAVILVTGACTQKKKEAQDVDTVTTVTTAVGEITLPEPDTTASKTNFADIIGWPAGKSPSAPAGFQVSRYAEGFSNPRWIYQAPNGDIFVAEANTEQNLAKKVASQLTGKAKSTQQSPSANRISILRDADADGVPELREVFLSGLKQPFGMLVLRDTFYVANTDAVIGYPYVAGQTKLDPAAGKVILKLPAGGYNNHWTRNIIANNAGTKIFVSVGSGSNVGENGMEHEVRRANILEINPDGSGERIYAAGLRNPVGMGFAPGSNVLWTVVNERDGLGDGLVPDYLTSVKENAFYGWPYSYFGQQSDPRLKLLRQDLVKSAVVPDVPLEAHSASLGLAFYKSGPFPSKYHGGAFIGQHGSWNSSKLTGYKVVFVPFANGRPSGREENFLTGFIAPGEKNQVYGRPVGVTVLRDCSMLVADDAANIIWRVSARKP